MLSSLDLDSLWEETRECLGQFSRFRGGGKTLPEVHSTIQWVWVRNKEKKVIEAGTEEYLPMSAGTSMSPAAPLL